MRGGGLGADLDKLNILVGEADMRELFSVEQPRMLQDLLHFDSLMRVNVEHALNQIL